ncbi:hypothetical protein CPB83DRAFT_845140 [Crepidotus variabilis]|uniref:F-box domain-containing protein n=1 Tax=Crepidotus variabilis TaxID=179855 RepID=A0A9P6ERJ1_9AGAR|nr:hypothetical protein CPB83DRAFT_845140 [Crepidotus variabilis]
MRDFPQELVDQVVEFLHDDVDSLRHCRLVCHAWDNSSSTHLFRSLNLLVSASSSLQNNCEVTSPMDRKLAKLKTLLALLKTSTTIQHYVRKVTFGRTSLLAVEDPVLYEQAEYARTLTSVFAHLHRLSDLFFREIDWSTLVGVLRTCILNICQTPTVQNIDIWNCQFPSIPTLLNFLYSCKGVQTLRLTHIRILNLSLNTDREMDEVNATDFGHQDRDTLRSLTIDSVPIPPKLYALLGMKGVIDFTRLSKLCLNNVTDAATIRECLERSGKSLEHLELRTSPFYRKPHDPSTPGPDLSHCPNLRHLRISGLQWTPTLCPAESLSATFANINASAYPLESLHLFVTVIKPRTFIFTQPSSASLSASDSTQTSDSIIEPSAPVSKDLNYGAWSILDSTLVQPQFTCLKSMHIRITPLRAGDVDLSRLSEAFRTIHKSGVDVQCT